MPAAAIARPASSDLIRKAERPPGSGTTSACIGARPFTSPANVLPAPEAAYGVALNPVIARPELMRN
ncbi:MAG: hypothetical protein R3D56_05070 [Paracoccaceae bacterium]